MISGNCSSGMLLLTHRSLLWRVTRNEFTARYAGSVLGIGWAVVAPLLVLGVYAAIYLVIFRVKPINMTPVEYVLYIFSGMVPFLAISEALTLGVSSVVTNKSVLANTVFPIDLVPAKAVFLSQGTLVVGLTVTILLAAFAGQLAWTAIFLPVLWLLYLPFLIGLNWMLSLFNVVFRDLQNIIAIVLMLIMVASPIAYTPDMVPSALKALVILNPFAYFIVAFQQLIILGQPLSVLHWLALIVLSGGTFALGSWFFTKAKLAIIDYL